MAEVELLRQDMEELDEMEENLAVNRNMVWDDMRQMTVLCPKTAPIQQVFVFVARRLLNGLLRIY